MRIFLSHTERDKPVVEPIALRLKDILGEENVFYDSWSIQPGDGIIDRMNRGLASPQFVFFFVSEASLLSRMVELEWQTALLKATRGECRIVPVRVTDCKMPPLMQQTLYIDLYSYGIEAAIVQIVNVIQGNSTFSPQYRGFSNLSYTLEGNTQTSVDVIIRVSHFMEPNPSFLVLVNNEEVQIDWKLNSGESFIGGFVKSVALDNGLVTNAISMSPLGGAITPSLPMTITISARQGQSLPKGVEVFGVLHKKTPTRYEHIPRLG